MTVSQFTIEAGKCYVTGLSEHRRVVEATTTDVTYEIIAGSINGGNIVTVSREKFAAEVDREIACPD